MEASRSSVNQSKERGSKSLNWQEKEDRISDLPDSLLQHILSFLPSTKESIQTGILSKRWRNQWTQVPVMVFECEDSDEEEDYARFTDNTLLAYDCLKIKKFHIAYNFKVDSNFTWKIHFATRRHVENLILDFYYEDENDVYMLPNFIFDNASLVELQISNCEFQLTRINWPALKELKLDVYNLKDSGSIQNVLSGSPSLESFQISYLTSVNPVTIASKSLKILTFVDSEIKHHLEISCPNLEELYVKIEDVEGPSIFPHKTLRNVLSRSRSLHSLGLMDCYFKKLVIKSKKLKRLDLGRIEEDNGIEISCPSLEELNWYRSAFKHCKLMNLPSLVCATLFGGSKKKVPSKILEELQQVQELKIQNWCVKKLSALKMQEFSYPSLHVKSLTLDHPHFKHISGIVNAIRCSPALESLVIKLHVYEKQKTGDVDLNSLEETNLDSNGTHFSCSVTRLKTVEIIGLSERDSSCKDILCFVKFLLKNARALQKMAVKLKDSGMDFDAKVSRKLLSFPRSSEHSIIELL